MLKIRELQKTYAGGIQALKRISLDVPPGVFGLGPNGAGKTTLMKIMATLLERSVYAPTKQPSSQPIWNCKKILAWCITPTEVH